MASCVMTIFHVAESSYVHRPKKSAFDPHFSVSNITMAEDGEERLSVGERLKRMKEREKAKKEDEKAEATQAPKRTSMSMAEKIAKMQSRGSADEPPPPPVGRSESSPKKGGGVAERLAKLQAGAGGGAATPSGSPSSSHDQSESGTAPRCATVAGGVRSTGGGIAARAQKLGGGAGIVLPGEFEVPTPPAPV